MVGKNSSMAKKKSKKIKSCYNKFVLTFSVKSSFMKSLSKQRILAGTDKTTDSELMFKDKEGLNQGFIKEMTANTGGSGGTFGFHMIGKTNEDEKVDVSETDIKVTYEVIPGSDLKTTADRATKKFNDLVDSGSVTLAKMKDEEEMIEKAQELYDKLGGN